MAKTTLPSVDDPVTQPTPKPAAKPVEEPKPGVQSSGHVSTYMVRANNRADTKITRAQSAKLTEKLRHLQDTGATLEDGRDIRTKSDAIRWMIEQPLHNPVR